MSYHSPSYSLVIGQSASQVRKSIINLVISLRLLAPAAAMEGSWNDHGFCVPAYRQRAVFTASVLYLTFVDLVVLMLSAWKLLPHSAESFISHLLLKDDLGYFVIA